MNDGTPRERLRENATGIASILVTGTWLVGLVTGQSWWLPALLFGYVVVVPLVAVVLGSEEDREEWLDGWTRREDATREETAETAKSGRDGRSGETPLERLRRRYAEGELTEEQFERKLERLLETETLEDAEDRARRRRGDLGRAEERATER
ncbi:MAG: SHOCT domain-containing protein [Haloferacaceae archaeon]